MPENSIDESHPHKGGCMADPRDVQIHIHEHVGPLRERVGKIEGQMQVHDRELSLLRAGLDGLRDRVDGAKDAMLRALETHTIDEIARYQNITEGIEGNKSKLDSLRNWMVGIGIGAGTIFGIFEFMARIGALRHGG